MKTLLCLSLFLLFSVVAASDDWIIGDNKSLKKLLKSRSRVIVVYSNSLDKATIADLTNSAGKLKGKGTLALVRCKDGKSSKKLCEDHITPEETYVAKFYKEGEFSADYKRPLKLKSFENFFANPEADAPWEEDSLAADVLHLNDNTIEDAIKNNAALLLMLYAPWCGHCKQLKPEFAAAATELKGKVALAGIDGNSPNGRRSAMAFNVTGYPTLVYFEKGEFKYEYGGGRTKQSIIDWLKNPGPPPPPDAPPAPWSETPSDVVHLTVDNFDQTLNQTSSVLVMFHTSWCGHCKQTKPYYTEAAEALKAENVNGIMAAVDAEKENSLAARFEVKGYPTFWYFKDGQKAFQYTLGRKKEDFVSFMKNPQEPPPPPPPEAPWSATPSKVVHLTDDTFHKSLKSKKFAHTLVMFYAPWCGHCKAFKPAYSEAADTLAELNKKIKVAAMDCTASKTVCKENGIDGFPTVKYFSNGKYVEEYSGERTKDGVISYLTSKALKTEL